MMTPLFTGLVFAVLWWMITRRRAAAVAGFFLLFSLVTRVLALAYVDLAGPVFAIELGEEVGGGGSSMPLFSLSVLAFMLPLAYAFRPSELRSWYPSGIYRRKYAKTIANVAFALIATYLVALYLDMFTRGPIPLIQGMDRLEYNSGPAGPLHPLAFDFAFLFAFTVGCMFVYPRLHGREFDFRFVWLLAAFFVYYALTGNRFSAFYGFSGYLVIPFAALVALRSVDLLPPAPKRRSPLARFLCSRSAFAVLICGVAAGLVGLLINSVVNVRAYDDPAEQFGQRTLIQPVQLWWTTWKTLGGQQDAAAAWRDTFLNPIDPTRNSSIQVLMIKNLGDERATELVLQGSQYAGGYPEILFELVGPWLALPVALAFGLITAFLMKVVVASVCKGHFLTALLAIYVCFGFNLLYIGGMLNFLIAGTFAVKVAALVVAYFLEPKVFKPKRPRAKRLSTRVAAPSEVPSTAGSLGPEPQ